MGSGKKKMIIIMIIAISIILFMGGFNVANIIRLRKTKKYLKELDMTDPNFEAKIEVIRVFNHFLN